MVFSLIRAEKKTKKKKILIGKIGRYALGLVALALVVYLLYYYIRYFSYDEYKDYLSSYEYEEGSDFIAIPEADPKVSGYELVAENDYLK